MEKKLKFVMIKENLTVGKVAAMLGVNSAVVSHILANRNKPSYQLIGKIAATFPKYNPYWWLGISEDIYNPNYTTTPESESELEAEELSSEKNLGGEVATSSTSTKSNSGDFSTAATSMVKNIVGSSTQPIERVIIVYADKTFETLTPKG